MINSYINKKVLIHKMYSFIDFKDFLICYLMYLFNKFFPAPAEGSNKVFKYINFFIIFQITYLKYILGVRVYLIYKNFKNSLIIALK